VSKKNYKSRSKASAVEQKHAARSAEEKIFAVCRVFNEIQTGPNPLTCDEVRALVEKRPEVYGCLRSWT
jgi:hypothetical protein